MNHRVLIVTENRIVSEILAQNIKRELGFEIIAAQSFQGAKEILERDSSFLIALLDQNLRDDPKGEILYTISIGLTCDYEDNIDIMMREADRQLYLAKKKGKDQVSAPFM